MGGDSSNEVWILIEYKDEGWVIYDTVCYYSLLDLLTEHPTSEPPNIIISYEQQN